MTSRVDPPAMIDDLLMSCGSKTAQKRVGWWLLFSAWIRSGLCWSGLEWSQTICSRLISTVNRGTGSSRYTLITVMPCFVAVIYTIILNNGIVWYTVYVLSIRNLSMALLRGTLAFFLISRPNQEIHLTPCIYMHREQQLAAHTKDRDDNIMNELSFVFTMMVTWMIFGKNGKPCYFLNLSAAWWGVAWAVALYKPPKQ